MPSVLVAAPSGEPLTLAEVRAHLRLDTNDQEPAPGAPTAALGSGAGNVDNGAHRYLVTFTTATGETQAGVASAAVTVLDKSANGKVALSGIPTGGGAVTGRKLYRTQADGNLFYALATIADNSTTTYTDNIADASLGAGAPAVNTTGDPLLSALISTARLAVETRCRRALMTQQWKLVLDQFPRPAMNMSSANWYGPQWGTMPGPLSTLTPEGRTGFEIFLPWPPLRSVDSIKYIDQYGVQQTLTTDQYLVDSVTEPPRVTPAFSVSWPATQNRMNAVEVAFTCGYGAASDVPAGIKQWMLLLIGTLYENRHQHDIAERVMIASVPDNFIDGLLDPYRVLSF
jgi:hypothetical protein